MEMNAMYIKKLHSFLQVDFEWNLTAEEGRKTGPHCPNPSVQNAIVVLPMYHPWRTSNSLFLFHKRYEIPWVLNIIVRFLCYIFRAKCNFLLHRNATFRKHWIWNYSQHCATWPSADQGSHDFPVMLYENPSVQATEGYLFLQRFFFAACLQLHFWTMRACSFQKNGSIKPGHQGCLHKDKIAAFSYR